MIKKTPRNISDSMTAIHHYDYFHIIRPKVLGYELIMMSTKEYSRYSVRVYEKKYTCMKNQKACGVRMTKNRTFVKKCCIFSQTA